MSNKKSDAFQKRPSFKTSGTFIDGARRRFPNFFRKVRKASGSVVLNKNGNAKWEVVV